MTVKRYAVIRKTEWGIEPHPVLPKRESGSRCLLSLKQWALDTVQLTYPPERRVRVCHECADGRTVILVPRELHDHLSHCGGVEMYDRAQEKE